MTLRDVDNIIKGWEKQQNTEIAYQRHFTWWMVNVLASEKITHQDILLMPIDPKQKETKLSEDEVEIRLEKWDNPTGKKVEADPFKPKHK